MKMAESKQFFMADPMTKLDDTMIDMPRVSRLVILTSKTARKMKIQIMRVMITKISSRILSAAFVAKRPLQNKSIS